MDIINEVGLMDAKNIRPTEYEDEIMREICWVSALSPYSLAELCELYTHWPDVEIIKKWLLVHNEFAELFIEAKEIYRNNFEADVLKEQEELRKKFFIDAE